MLMAHHNGAPPDHHGARVDDDDADILFAPSLAMDEEDGQHSAPAYTRYVAGLRESAAHLHAFLASHIHDAGAPRELAVAARTLAAVDLLIDSLADLAPRLADLHDEHEVVDEQQPRAVEENEGDHHHLSAVEQDNDAATNGVYSEYEHHDYEQEHDYDDDDVHTAYATAERDDDNGNYHDDEDDHAAFAAAYNGHIDPSTPPNVAPAATTLGEHDHDDDATDRTPMPAAPLSTHEPAVPDAPEHDPPATPPSQVFAPVPLAATPPDSSVTRHFASLYRTASTRSAATGSNTLATSLDAVDFYAGYAADNAPPAVPPIPEAEEPAPVATGKSPMRALIGRLDALHEEFQRYVHGNTPPASPAQNATTTGPKLPPRSSLPPALGNANKESSGVVMRSGISEEDDDDDDFQSVLSSPAGSVSGTPAPIAPVTVPAVAPPLAAPIHVDDDIDDDIDDVPCHFHTESLRRTTTSPPPPGIDLPAAVPHSKKRAVAESVIDDSPTPRPSTSVHPAPTAAPRATTPAPAAPGAAPTAYHRTAEHRRPAPARPSPTHTPSPAPTTPAVAPAPAPAPAPSPAPAPAPALAPPTPQPSTTLSTAVTAPAYRPRATMADLAADAAADAAAARAAVAEHDRRIAAAMQRARHSSLPATTSPVGGDHESNSGSGSSLGAGVPIPRAHLLADTPPAARLAKGALEEAAAVIASHMPPDVVQEHQRRKAQDKTGRGRAMSEPDVGRGARRAASAHDDSGNAAAQHEEQPHGADQGQQPRRASASALKRGTSPGPKGRVAFAEEVAVVTPIIPASKKRSNPLGALKKMIFSRSSSSSSSPPAPTNAVPRPSSPSASGDKYPGRAAAAAAAMAMLTRSESQLSRHIHEAEANMEQNMRVIATVGAEVAAREQWEAQLVAQLGHEQAAAVIAAARAAHEQQMEMARPVAQQPQPQPQPQQPDLLQPPPPSGLPTAIQVPSSLSSDAEDEDDEEDDEEDSRASSPSVDGPPRHHHQPPAVVAAAKPAPSPSPKPADSPASPASDAPKVTAAAAASRAVLAAAGNTVAPLHRGPSTHLVAPDHAASALVRTNTRTRASTKVVTLDPAATPSETASLVASGALHASLTREVSQRVLPPAAEASAAVPPDTSGADGPAAAAPAESEVTPAASDESEDDDYDEAELWPLVELPAPGSDGGIRKRAASVLRHVAVDAVGYYSANEPDERRAHARAFQAAFLARRASPAVAALHRALMRVSVARLVAALDPRRSMEGATDPLAPEDVLRAFVAGFADDPAGLCGGSLPVLLTTDGRAAAQPVPQGLAGRLVPPNDLAAARARFTPPHPVVNRLLDRLAAVLALARLAGLALLFPAPGARFVREYMANAAPALPPVALLDGGDDPAAQHRQLAAELQEAASSLADAGAHRPPLGLDEDDDDGEDDDETVLGASMPRVKVVVALVFPGLLDAHGAVLAKAQVVAQ